MTLLRQASPPPEATVAVAQAPVAGASAVRRPATPPKPVETAEIECGCCFTDTDIVSSFVKPMTLLFKNLFVG